MARKKASKIKHIEILSSFTLYTGKNVSLTKMDDGWRMYDSTNHTNIQAPTLDDLEEKAKEILDELANKLYKLGYGKKCLKK